MTTDIDADALREKYRAERDTRLRPDGSGQYREPSGALNRFLDDPNAIDDRRAPVHDHVDAVIIGGGFSGLLAGVRLREAGLERIRIIDTGRDVGGTWYWNRYPGVQCDIESYIYLPLLEQVGSMPSEKYAHGDEILDHSRAIARQWDLYRDALFGTHVERMEWHDDHWTVHTDRDDAMTTKYVVSAIGPLSRLKLPGIPGIEQFEGHAFHTSRWDYDYTGGDSTGGLVGLADKRVGIIGTGATSIQCIPHLG
ncbi:MAG: flavin-containing monooxygenase, partial [Actinomycetales bacterium]